VAGVGSVWRAGPESLARVVGVELVDKARLERGATGRGGGTASGGLCVVRDEQVLAEGGHSSLKKVRL